MIKIRNCLWTVNLRQVGGINLTVFHGMPRVNFHLAEAKTNTTTMWFTQLEANTLTCTRLTLHARTHTHPCKFRLRLRCFHWCNILETLNFSPNVEKATTSSFMWSHNYKKKFNKSTSDWLISLCALILWQSRVCTAASHHVTKFSIFFVTPQFCIDMYHKSALIMEVAVLWCCR